METQMKGLKAEDMTHTDYWIERSSAYEKSIQPSIPWPFSCFIVLQH